MFNFLSFVLWIVSLVMMIVDFHWGWLVAFIITTLYFLIRFDIGGTIGIHFDFDLFD